MSEVVMKDCGRGHRRSHPEQAGPPERVDTGDGGPLLRAPGRVRGLRGRAGDRRDRRRQGLLCGRRHEGPAGPGFRRGRQRAGGQENAERPPRTTPTRSPSRSSPQSTARVPASGLVQALMCDIRFAASGAKLNNRLRPPGAGGRARDLLDPAAAGGARGALDLLLSGRVVLAEEAHELGLVNRVDGAGGPRSTRRSPTPESSP